MYKILVVDDMSDLREQLVWAVEGSDRQVMEAESSMQAVQLIEEYDFDVIVTDMQMGEGKDGLAVLRFAKEKDPDVQVIVVTNFGSPEDSVDTMRLGAFDYIERASPGTNFLNVLQIKVTLAIEFRSLKMKYN